MNPCSDHFKDFKLLWQAFFELSCEDLKYKRVPPVTLIYIVHIDTQQTYDCTVYVHHLL